MKRIVLIALILLSALGLSACVVNPNIYAVPIATVHTGNSPAAPSADLTNQIGSGTIGKYAVKIIIFEIIKEADGKGETSVVLNYEWTNNSDKATSFSKAMQDKVCQAGIECEAAVLTDNDKYDLDSAMSAIEPGSTQTVQRVYKLNDTAAPLDIEISELQSIEETPAVVKQTFEIK